MCLPTFFKEPHLLSRRDPSEPILLGLSGGADSSALLHLLCAYREISGCRVFAAHLNHGIRGEKYGNEADRDERFCRDTCQRLGVELFVKRADIPALSKESGKSLETEARDMRYEFFAEIMRENNIKILATAHNADDSLETQLSNLARGCGIDGMIGIPETRSLDAVGGIIIRPILRAEKCEIMAYCTENDIPYVTDSTNLEDDCTRNIIRHNIIPRLEELFPSVKRASSRLSCSAAEDSDFILNEADRFISACNGELLVSRLQDLHPSLKKRVIMLTFEKACGTRLESIHISDVISLLSSKKNGASISLPQKMRACIIDGRLIFENDTKAPKIQEIYDQKLFFGLNAIENTPFLIHIGKEMASCPPCGCAFYASAEFHLPNIDSIHAKNRSAGAFILDGGVNKKIKKLMCDKRVPLLDRNILPIIYSGDEAIYLPLCAVCDRVKKQTGCDTVRITIFKYIGGTHE